MAERLSLRSALAATPAVAVVLYAWTLLEDPVAARGFLIAAVLALVPALVVDWRWRIAASVVTVLVGFAAVLETWPHDAVREVWEGLRDAPAVQAPFDPADFPTLHGLVVLVPLALALVASLGAASRRPWVVAAAVAVGVGFPAVLLEDGHALRLGLLALGAVLWAGLVLGASDVRRGLAGMAVAAALVAVSGGAALAGLSSGAGHVDWRGWDPFAGGGDGDIQFLWDASYSGIDFPTRPTTMLRIRAPARQEYWRMSTLETFTGDRWIEHLYPAALAGPRRRLPPSPLAPRRDTNPGAWLEQTVTVVGLDDSRVPAATEAARIDGRTLGRIEYMQGGVMLAHKPLRRGDVYTVWSYAPSPSSRQLAASPARYPSSAGRYVQLESASFPWFGTPGRDALVEKVFRSGHNRPLLPYRPLWQDARRLTVRARSPYEATLALESWFRDRGGFRYEEHPPVSNANPPLVDFVQVTHAGYCQHYAGAMALMLRTLGIPARVAVGFTAGTWKAGVWTVTDQQAHAWVEAWFAGYGWLPFDPTPDRGTLTAGYTFASDSADVVRALGAGRFVDFTSQGPTTVARGAAVAAASEQGPALPWWVVPALLAPVALALGVVGVKRARRVRRLHRDDPRRLAAGVRAELVDALVDRGAIVEADATPTELRRIAERVLRVPALSLTEAIAEARYGPAARAGSAAQNARGELRRILAATAAREEPRARMRAALSLRSLRPEAPR